MGFTVSIHFVEGSGFHWSAVDNQNDMLAAGTDFHETAAQVISDAAAHFAQIGW